MIIQNKQQNWLTLVAFLQGEKVSNSLQILGETTMVVSEQVIYYCLGKNLTIRKLKAMFEKFVKNNKYNLNIDVESFFKVLGKTKEIFQVLVETFSYWNKPLYSLKSQPNKELTFNFIFTSEWQQQFDELQLKAEFVNFARDLQNMPPNLADALSLTDLIVKKAATIPGVKVNVLNQKDIEKLGMGLLLAVNAGSTIEARVVTLEYCGNPQAPKTALVGKGITFDSGGYNLKSSPFIKDMKFDMTGAAVVCGSVLALAQAQAKCNVVGILMFTDNRIGENAMLPESIYQSMNGKTVEITNTDAEGRLVLADGVTYAVKNFGAQKILTAATLTGAIRIALGRWYVGMFSNNDTLAQDFLVANEKAQEYSWRLPLLTEHLDVMKRSKIADLVNSEPGSEAGSSTAAAFIESFAEQRPFLHVDLSGVARLNSEGTAPMLKSFFELLK